jgi:hypothetical protein
VLQKQSDHEYDVRRGSSLHQSSEHALPWSCWSSSAQADRANARIHARLLFYHTEANSHHLVLALTKSASRSVIFMALRTRHSHRPYSRGLFLFYLEPTLHSRLASWSRRRPCQETYCFDRLIAILSWNVPLGKSCTYRVGK